MQGTAERRSEIMKLLCRRRSETIRNLAFEFEVSERTIRRDIEILSLNEPIYTQVGRYGGGVYVEEGYAFSQAVRRFDFESKSEQRGIFRCLHRGQLFCPADFRSEFQISTKNTRAVLTRTADARVNL